MAITALSLPPSERERAPDNLLCVMLVEVGIEEEEREFGK
jgi:hypothetical protein